MENVLEMKLEHRGGFSLCILSFPGMCLFRNESLAFIVHYPLIDLILIIILIAFLMCLHRLRKYRIRGEEDDNANDALPGLRKPKPQGSDMRIVTSKGKKEDTESLKDEINRLRLEVKEVDTLRQELKKMKSEMLHMSKCLEEAHTEAEA